jgi:hypothetical protein
MDLERDLIYFGRTKNRKLKSIPMNKAVKEVVGWLLKHRCNEYLFSWPWGKQIGRTTIYDAFKKACTEAKVEQMRFHDLRHTAASYLVMGGVDLPTVKEILGHREIEMTLRYSHLAPAHKAKAVEKLGEALNSAVQNRENRAQEAQEPRALAANLAQNRNIFLVRSGRGLSVVEPKPEANQGVNPTGEWGGGNRITILSC